MAVTDLDTEVKQSLRVQPIESSTMFGKKFPDIVKQYKHRSLQMAVDSNKQQRSSIPRKFLAKVPESSVKKSTGSLNVAVVQSDRTSFSHNRHFDRSQRRNSDGQPLKKPKGRQRGAHFDFQASEHTLKALSSSIRQVPRPNLPRGGRISFFLEAWEK